MRTTHGSCATLALASQLFSGCGGGAYEENTGTAQDEVIWTNAVYEYYEMPAARKFVSNSTAAVMRNSDVTCTAPFCTLRTTPSQMCAGQRFSNQRSLPGNCTSFLVGPKHFATAAHCLTPERIPCSNLATVFHWRKDGSAAANENILPEHIYRCTSVLANGDPYAEDWAVYEVDRPVTSSTVTPRGPLALSIPRATVGTSLFVPNHFAGLPMKWTGGTLKRVPARGAASIFNYLQAEIDIIGGSSGAPWIDTNTSKVVGLLQRGPTEPKYPERDGCFEEKNCNLTPSLCNQDTHVPKATPAWIIPKGPNTLTPLIQWGKPTGTPYVGDYDGDGKSDILWFGSGTAEDRLWWGTGGGNFTVGAITINTKGNPTVGDYDGDGRSDLLFYWSGLGEDFVWFGQANRTFTQTNVSQQLAGLRAVSGDFDGDGRSDVFFYGPGATADSVWYGQPRGSTPPFAVVPITQTLTDLIPEAGDFDGDGRSDVLFFWPGSGNTDQVWYGKADRSFTPMNFATSITGVTPIAGDFDANSRSDILWFRPNSTLLTSVWVGTPDASFESKKITLPAGSSVAAGRGDFNGDALDDLVLLDALNVTILKGKTWAD